jgi:hypothetical protein
VVAVLSSSYIVVVPEEAFALPLLLSLVHRIAELFLLRMLRFVIFDVLAAVAKKTVGEYKSVHLLATHIGI